MKHRNTAIRIAVSWVLILAMAVPLSACGSSDTTSPELEMEENAEPAEKDAGLLIDDPPKATDVDASSNLEDSDAGDIGTDLTVIPQDPLSQENVSSVEDTNVEESAPEFTPEDNPATEAEALPESVSSPVLTPAPEVQQVVEDTSLDDELAELEDMDSDELTPTQRNAINMLNYMTVITQEINASSESRLFLDSADSTLYNNMYPNSVDTKTQTQITNMLNTIHRYQMISVKRERLEYIYEQNQAQALRQAIPNPIGLLSAVQSGSFLKAAISVIYMATDSVTSYQSAASQAELQYLQSGWELDDEEADEIQNSRINALNYMFNMVRDNAIPGDYALNEESVVAFVSWKNNTNLVRKIAWFEANESTYSEFGPYWLELAKDYYDSEEYEKCLYAFERYEIVTTRIFRNDYDYAEALPMAIVAAKETMSVKDYVDFADKYSSVILDNTKDSDWALRYFVAQIYLDLFARTNDNAYIDAAYRIALENVNVLVDEQKALNEAYLDDVKEVSVDKDATKQQKEDARQYNKLLRAERKVALPPVSEALYLNCELLFSLAEEMNISEKEKSQIDSILHENGESIFLTEAIDSRFRFDNSGESFDAAAISVEFDGKKFTIPASCITNRSIVTVTVSGPNGITEFTDWAVDEVIRPKNADVSAFTTVFISSASKAYNYTAGEVVTITIIPVEESPDEILAFSFNVVPTKTLWVFNGIEFERV